MSFLTLRKTDFVILHIDSRIKQDLPIIIGQIDVSWPCLCLAGLLFLQGILTKEKKLQNGGLVQLLMG